MSIPQKIFIIFFPALLVGSANAQTNPKVDSLQQQIKHYQNKKGITADTTVYNIYMALGNEIEKFQPDSAITYYTLAENKAKQFKDPIKQAEAIRSKGWCFFLKSNYTEALNLYEQAIKSIETSSVPKTNEKNKKNTYAKIIGNIGSVYYVQGNYAKTLDHYFKALMIFEEMGDKKNQSINMGNIGLVYSDQGDYAKALDYYFKALAINEEIGNKQNQAINLGNIGLVYWEQGDDAKALNYYFKALTINEEMGNKQNQAINLGNIGIVYRGQGDDAKALDYYFKALAINEEIGNKRGQAFNLGNIGIVYRGQGDDAKALDYYFKALAINEEMGDKQNKTINLGNIGEVYLQQKQYALAKKYLLQAIQMGEELKIIYLLKSFYQSLSKLYTQTHQYQQALEAYKQHVAYKDSLNSEENQKALATKEMQYQFEKQQTEERAQHQQELLKKEAQQKQQKLYTLLSLSIAAAILIILVIVFKSLHTTKKQKQIIEKAHNEIAEQKKIVEEKNKDILDSITYAKRIQNAILPNENKWIQLLPNSFVLYLPKDIVAGDFYWLEETEDYIYFAAADCTGHGVPGAMVSVVCSNALNKTVKEFGITEPDKILDKTRDLVLETFAQSESEIKDGMDISLCSLNMKTRELKWSGANNPLWYIRENELNEIKGDKQSIGKNDNPKPFTLNTIQLQKEDTIYIFTDGYADQFGGEKGKKFMYKPLKNLLLEIHRQSLVEQKEILQQHFANWKGNIEQTDDVLIIGVKI